MIAGNAAGPIAASATTGGLTFIEQTEAGGVVFVTVFTQQLRGEPEYIAVTSRHLANPDGFPLVSQFYGTCTILPND